MKVKNLYSSRIKLFMQLLYFCIFSLVLVFKICRIEKFQVIYKKIEGIKDGLN